MKFELPLCVIVTGAGRGFGKDLCTTLAEHVPSGSTFLLLGRNEEQLKKTQSAVLSTCSSASCRIYPGYDCSKLSENDLLDFLQTSRSPLCGDFGLLVLHNAGSVGDPSQKAATISYADATDYMTLNFAAAVSTNTAVMQVFGDLKNINIVQISSLCGVSPFKSLSLYCAGKAARDMYFKVFAQENPHVRVLNYAPGPLSTDMYHTIANQSHDEDIKTAFEGMTPLQPQQSARKLVEVLLADKYEQGQHVDYYD